MDETEQRRSVRTRRVHDVRTRGRGLSRRERSSEDGEIDERTRFLAKLYTCGTCVKACAEVKLEQISLMDSKFSRLDRSQVGAFGGIRAQVEESTGITRSSDFRPVVVVEVLERRDR